MSEQRGCGDELFLCLLEANVQMAACSARKRHCVSSLSCERSPSHQSPVTAAPSDSRGTSWAILSAQSEGNQGWRWHCVEKPSTMHSPFSHSIWKTLRKTAYTCPWKESLSSLFLYPASVLHCHLGFVFFFFVLHEDLPKIESCLPVVFNVFKLEVGFHLNDSAAIPWEERRVFFWFVFSNLLELFSQKKKMLLFVIRTRMNSET